MKKSHMFRIVLLSTMFALLAIVLMVPAASAHTAAPAHRAATSQISTNFPTVNIVIKHGKAVFSPSTIHCKACILIAITNLTNVNQEILFGKVRIGGSSSLVLIPGITFTLFPSSYINASRAGRFVVGLKSNPHARLIILSS
jgi:hypothetical protein